MLQNWLLAYEFPDTVLLVTHDTVHALCSVKKGKVVVAAVWNFIQPLTPLATLLEQLNQDAPNVRVTIQTYKRTKDDAENQKVMLSFLSAMDNHVSAVCGGIDPWGVETRGRVH